MPNVNDAQSFMPKEDFRLGGFVSRRYVELQSVVQGYSVHGPTENAYQGGSSVVFVITFDFSYCYY